MQKYIEIARETVAKYPDQGVDLQHLLAVVIGPKATPELCGKLASYGIRRLSEMMDFELREQGLSHLESQRIAAVFKIARKLVTSYRPEYKTVHSPEAAAYLLMDEMRFLTQEHFVCLYLNAKNEVLRKETVFIGSLNSSIVHPREVFKNAFKCSAASVICLHNHPSGDPSPSREDIAITERLVECGKMVGIEVLDHIVIGDGKFISLKEKGYV